MVFVMLGTQNNNFSRLLDEIEKLIKNGIIKDEVIVQAGYTKYHSDCMKILDFIPREEIEQYQRNASYIITHGGVGSIISSLKMNKKVIAVPRLHEFSEHVNNHQIDIVNLFQSKGYIIGINDIVKLGEAVNKIHDFVPMKYNLDNTKMLKIIEDFIDNVN